MSRIIKLTLFLLFAILLLAIYFLVFYHKASAPQKILIKNSDNAAPVAPEIPENTAENRTTEINSLSEKTPRDEGSKKNLPITDYQLLITKKLVSWGFTPFQNRKIDTIIIHSSYNALGGGEYDVAKLIQEYKEYGVAPHYLIDREGKTYKLVEEKNIAYHAGESKTPDGRTGVNNFSLGIEIITTKEESPTDAQYAALNELISDIKTRYSIKYVLGHDDIAPERKTDPWNFDWGKIKQE